MKNYHSIKKSILWILLGTSANKHNDTVIGFTAYLTGNGVYYETNEVIKFAGEISFVLTVLKFIGYLIDSI